MLTSGRIFLKVVEQGSFSKAGQVLSLAPSSISRTIDNLEKELQVALFKRSTRQLVLTEHGQQFLQGITQLLMDADKLQRSLTSEETDPSGGLRISTFESFGQMYICPLLAGFLSRYPKVNIDIELDNNPVDLSADNIDLAIRVGNPQDSSLKARTLLHNHTVICASKDYFSRNGIPEHPQQLEEHNCLLINQSRQRHHWLFSQEQQQLKVAVNGNLKSKGGIALLAAALSGVGIAQLPNWMVSDAISNGQLICCLTDWTARISEHTVNDIYAIYKLGPYPNPLIRLFIDYLLEQLQKIESLTKT